MSGAVSLLANATVTGAGVTWPGGTGVFTAAGTFGGTIVALEVLGPDGATWLNAGSDGTLTAAGMCAFDLPQGQIRASITGGTPAGIYALAAKV
jgi:hypothetical protein